MTSFGSFRAAVLPAVAAALMAAALPLGAARADQPSVAVTAIVEHPALDAVVAGVRDTLAEAGLVAGETLTWRYESAQGNPATAAQIARKFVGDAPDVIVPISTPSAQAVVAATSEIPVVFSAVTDPVAARLVVAPAAPGANVTGVTDLSPMNKHLDLIRRITPDVATLGAIFNPGEANAVVLIDLLKELAPAHGITVVTAAAPKSAAVLAAAQSLVGKVDAFYVGTDNTVVSALEAIVKVAVDNQIPFYAGDTNSVERGAMAAVGFNYYDVGRQTGAMVLRILDGADPGGMPVEGVEIVELFLNPGIAERMGVTISAEMLDEATTIVE